MERIKSDQRSTWKWIRVQLKRLEQFANAIAFVIYRTIINDRVVNRVYLIASAASARARVRAQIYQNVGEHSRPIKGSSNDRPPPPNRSLFHRHDARSFRLVSNANSLIRGALISPREIWKNLFNFFRFIENTLEMWFLLTVRKIPRKGIYRLFLKETSTRKPNKLVRDCRVVDKNRTVRC